MGQMQKLTTSLILTILCAAATAHNVNGDTLPRITNGEGAIAFESGVVLRGNVLECGGTSVLPLVYYGPYDGGTNASSWACCATGTVSGAGEFNVTVEGLSEGSNYYYRAVARNAAGQAWAPVSEGFQVKTAYSASDVSVDERPKVLDMLDRKRDIDAYVMVEEQWRFERLGIDVTTWEGWTAAYHVTNFTPPIVFDTRAPVVGSNDTVTNALRLWLHAWETRNITDLYAYADESQREAMDKCMGAPRPA